MEESQKYVELWLYMVACALSDGSSYHTDYTFCHHLKIKARDDYSFLGSLTYSVASATEGQDEVHLRCKFF